MLQMVAFLAFIEFTLNLCTANESVRCKKIKSKDLFVLLCFKMKEGTVLFLFTSMLLQ